MLKQYSQTDTGHITKARDEAMNAAKVYHGKDDGLEDIFLRIAQELDWILRPELMWQVTGETP